MLWFSARFGALPRKRAAGSSVCSCVYLSHGVFSSRWAVVFPLLLLVSTRGLAPTALLLNELKPPPVGKPRNLLFF